ncbi:MAG: type II CRISPR-associated endonuclease Cas1 [Bacteroidales bacterium]|jgi:CRISPR-associated protein Cas1|nr:type II CRISPR-associated endonuclease Cas1 [Bacteroidales bacterium]
MVKKTLYFGNPAYLSLKNNQLVIKLPGVEENDTLPDSFKQSSIITKPIEDIGYVILDNKQITITHSVLTALIENNVAIIQCNDKHLPAGMMMNLNGHSLQCARFKSQIEASEPLKKQLWQQTVEAKIENQIAVLKSEDIEDKRLNWLLNNVKSGDSDNAEGQAAAIYWRNIFSNYISDFKRGREEQPPNNLLNYGYSLLRAAMARSLTGSGLLPVVGIFHHNQYNSLPLSDDIMEPYRPFIDKIVLEILKENESVSELTTKIKIRFLSSLEQDVFINKERSPLMVAMTTTTASLQKCFDGNRRRILYPKLIQE